jgi:transcriptional regulator with XRE-family HTH domain
MALAERLVYLRAEKMLTQHQLGELAGVSAITIGRTEAGGYIPHGATLQKLATALGVEIKDLITPSEMIEGRRRGKSAAA